MNHAHVPSVSFAAACDRFAKAARNKCADIPKFAATHNGCIRITAVPHRFDANWWMHPDGCLDMLHTAEQVYPIYEDGSYNITTDDGEVVNCYAYSAMKIAYCMALVEAEKTFFSCPDEVWGEESDDFFKAYTEDCGFARHYGCVCVRIFCRNDEAEDPNTYDLPYLDIYFCVSGADQKEDLQCAYAMANYASSVFRDAGNNFRTAREIIILSDIDNLRL